MKLLDSHHHLMNPLLLSFSQILIFMIWGKAPKSGLYQVLF